MDRQVAQAIHDSLIWLPSLGMGYLEVQSGYAPYDDAYFRKYQEYAATERGRAINKFRLDLVAHYTPGPVLDIGIGCGSFVEARNAVGCPTLGFDVNPAGVTWLNERGWFYDWRETNEPLESVTCWDVLEHLHDPHYLLEKITGYLFLSLPIFRDVEHVLSSKHFRPDEHCLYFTDWGLIRWMQRYGFDVLETSWRETTLGREDIGSYVFKRRRGPADCE